jgi:hypothetical protein|tara:strand:- start:979 stop:1254 length:276 start_codon:yes stop_codon:yes gene_type:complete
MAKGPNASNRNFKVFKDISIPQSEYLIEVWDAKDFDKDTKAAKEVSGAQDIKIYKRDETKPYNKGDGVAFFRVFNNEPKDSTSGNDEIKFD